MRITMKRKMNKQMVFMMRRRRMRRMRRRTRGNPSCINCVTIHALGRPWVYRNTVDATPAFDSKFRIEPTLQPPRRALQL
eukprot:9307086-Pyramimonas_sp.AAC.1